VKKGKDVKRTATEYHDAKSIQGFLDITAHAIGATLGGIAVKAGIVKPSSTGKPKAKSAATQPKAISKQNKRKQRKRAK
jgi:hypothetical protein